jgi:hypothetical protein
LDTVIKEGENIHNIFLSFCANKMLIFSTKPYSKKDSINPILKNYSPWDSTCIMDSIYGNSSQRYFNEIKWSYFFDKNCGVLSRLSVALIVSNFGEYTINASKSIQIQLNWNSPILLGIIVYPIEKFIE